MPVTEEIEAIGVVAGEDVSKRIGVESLWPDWELAKGGLQMEEDEN